MQNPSSVCINQLLSALNDIAPGGYGVGLQVRRSIAMIYKINYPKEWLDHHETNGFLMRDPLIAWAMSGEGVARWSEIAEALPDPFGIWEAAASFGLNFGIAASVGPVASRSIISCARGDREFTDEELAEVLEIAKKLHASSTTEIELTPAQIEALACVANGDRHAQAAARLGISESALKARLVSARERLCSRTTSEAVQKAKALRLI